MKTLKIVLSVLALMLLTGGIGHAADVDVTFTWKTGGEQDLASCLVTEYDEAMTPTGNTFPLTVSGGQIDCSLPATLSFPDAEETTLCYTVHATDSSDNDSAESNTVCKRVDEVPPGSCIDFGILD